MLSKLYDRAVELLKQPGESLNVEIKTWINPKEADGLAKIVKGLFALRNRDGGYFIIGLNDKSLMPDPNPLQEDVSILYHIDAIQKLVSDYAHEHFEIAVCLLNHGGQIHPVIEVPNGVRTPVLVKSDFAPTGGKLKLAVGDIYFRTLRSNGIVSSAKILPRDFADLMEICFNNREADIGAFVRRQLAGSNLASLVGALSGTTKEPSVTLRERAETLLDRGLDAYSKAVAASPLPFSGKRYLTALTTEVAMVLEPFRPDEQPTREFLARFYAGNPNYDGWPAWLDSRLFPAHPEWRTKVENGCWVSFIKDVPGGNRDRLELQLLDPRGDFYQRRLSSDDARKSADVGVALDPILMIDDVTGIIAGGLASARSAGWNPEDTVGFAFRWRGLRGRKLIGWAHPMRFLGPGEESQSRDDMADAFVTLSAGTPSSALGAIVAKAVGPLFAKFDGYSPAARLIEESVRTVTARRV